MLHTETVNQRLLEILNELMINSFFESFYLVGGTNLALQLVIGNRLI
jgi:hypothetical protein